MCVFVCVCVCVCVCVFIARERDRDRERERWGEAYITMLCRLTYGIDNFNNDDVDNA